MSVTRGARVLVAGCAAALALCGCSTLGLGPRRVERAPAPPVLEVRPADVVQVQPPEGDRVQPPRSCVPRTLGAPPRYPDSDAALRAAAGAADRYQLMAAGRLMRQRRLDELERTVAGCR